jgi:Na+/melibiose symporter-like transporter
MILFWEAETMRQRIVITTICLLVCLGGLAVSAWLILSGQIARQGIDALFLLAVALLMVFAFSLIPVQEFRRGLLGEIREALQARKARPAPRADEAKQPEGAEGT